MEGRRMTRDERQGDERGKENDEGGKARENRIR